MKGKTLYPHVCYKGAVVHVNFGPHVLAPLPFKCRLVQDASKGDVSVAKADTPAGGKHDLIVPVGLPDEGTFDWLDMFLEKNKDYTELSDRAILSWAEKSGITRPKGYAARASN